MSSVNASHLTDVAGKIDSSSELARENLFHFAMHQIDTAHFCANFATADSLEERIIANERKALIIN